MKPHPFLLALIAVSLLIRAASGQTVNTLPGRTIVKLLPDYNSPRVLALNQAVGALPGTVLALNPTNGAVLAEISVNRYPTDMATSPAGDALYVINAGSRTISKVDLTSFTVVAEKAITTPVTYDPSNPLYLIVSPSGKIYYTDGAWGPEIYAFDYNADSSTLVLNTGGNGSSGAGGMVMNRAGDTIYIWQQYGWGAGLAGSAIASLAVGTNALTTIATGPAQSRDPLNTPIFIDGGQKWIFNKLQKVAATNVTVLLTQFTDNIYGISLDGTVAFGPSEVFNAQSGMLISTMPFSTSVQTLSGDQKRLLRYNPASASIFVYDMANVAAVIGLAIEPTPADGVVVALPPTNLVWNALPTALAYDVYLGSDQSAVGAATTSSSAYLGRVSTPGIAPGQPLAPGSTYYWRVDPIGFSSTNAGPTWSFTVSRIAITPAQVGQNGIAGYNPLNTSLSLTSAAPTTWTAAVTGASWLTINAGNGTTPATVTLAFNAAGFAAGSYTNNVEFTVGGLKVEVPVVLSLAPLSITKMAADLARPYIYALQAPAHSGQNGQLLVINTTTGNLDKTLLIGINPVDLTIHYGENRLYVASWTENATYVVDLASQTLLPPLQLGADVYKINAGKPGRIVTEGEDQWIAVNLVDTASGTVVSSLPYPEREGDGEMNPAGTVYYHCDNDISDAHIHKEQIINDVATEVAASNEHPYGSRNLVLSPDGLTLFWQGYIYDANLNELASLGEEIYASTVHGDLALGGQHVFNTHNGQTVYTWPFSSTAMAVSGDQQNVFLYNGASHQLVMIPMSSIASIPGPGLNPTPANGAVVNPPLPSVSWSSSPFALSYRVFLGTDAAAVAAAGTNSALYLGATTGGSFSLSASINSGATYFWRVDSVGFSGVTTGAVWSFTVSALTVTPQTLSLSGVTGLPLLPQPISLSAPVSTPWTATVAQPWLTVSATNGAAPASLALSLNTTNLTAGLYTNQITFSANGITLVFPVTLRLFDLNASKMVADPNRNYLYVLHPGSGNFADAFLLFLNTDTGVVEKVIPIGVNPTDMAVNRFEDRLYVSNWQHNQTHVVDLKTGTELAPLALGTDVYKLNAGLAGRIFTEGEDQWITINIISTTTGAVVGSFGEREGDGETDPSGTFYYHCDNNISDAHVHKLQIVNDSATEVAASNVHAFGTRNLVLSADGGRLFWNGYVYDSNLTELGPLGAEIYACSTNGAIAFGDQQAFDAAARSLLYNLPVTSSVKAVDRLDQRLWYFNSTTHRIDNLPLLVIRQPAISQQPATNTAVATGGNVYLTVASLGLSPFSYQWTRFGTNLLGQTNYFLSLNNLQSSQQGNYQVIVRNPYGAVTSAVAQVTALAPPAVTQQPAGTNVSAGQPFSLSVAATGAAPLAYRWTFDDVNLDGATNSTLVISNAQAANGGNYLAIIRNVAGSATSIVAAVQVVPAAPTIFSSPISIVAPVAANVVFSVAAVGSQPIAYQWLFNGKSVAGGTNFLLALNNAQTTNAGDYVVVVSNAVGTVTVTNTLAVDPSAQPGLTFTTGSATGAVGERIAVPIAISHVASLKAFQFSLHWDPAVAAFAGLTQFGLPGLGSDTFGTNNAGAGVLTVSWDDPSAVGQSPTNGTVVFALQFDLIGGIGATTPLSINGTPTAIQAADANLAPLPVSITTGTLQISRAVRISGTVRYYDQTQPVAGVTLTLDGDARQTTQSAANGTYSFTVAPGGYTVTPGIGVDSAPSQGVTTLDIALIRRQVLSITTNLVTPFELLAADVRLGGDVSTIDIALIRRLILGLANSFPSGLWRFVPADYQFADPLNPWAAPGARGYTNVTADSTAQDFIAIKLGDVRAAWSLPAASGAAGTSSSERLLSPPTVKFSLGSPTVAPGGDVKVAVSVSGFTEISTLQFTLAWDPTVLEYVRADDFALNGLAAGNFGDARVSQGRLACSWDEPNGAVATLPEGSVLFTLTLKAIGADGANSAVSFTDDPTVREVTANLNVATFATQNGTVRISSAPEVTNVRLIRANGQFQWSVSGNVGDTYQVQTSTDLRHWTNLDAVINTIG